MTNSRVAAVKVAALALFIIAVQCREFNRPGDDFERKARIYIDNLDRKSSKGMNKIMIATWNYELNMNNKNEAEKIKISSEVANDIKEDWNKTINYPWMKIKDPMLKRMFKLYSDLQSSALPQDRYQLLTKVTSAMLEQYTNTRICSYKYRAKCDLAVEPEITDIFTKSADPEELKDAWTQWHNLSGARIRNNYTLYVELQNEAARYNNHKDAASTWISEYEEKDFEKILATLWKELRPLYRQLHAYVRKRLRDRYGEKVVSAKGPIPAHLLGSLWGQTWENIEQYTLPYPHKKAADITRTLLAQGYTPLKLFQTADNFYRSLNLSKVPEKFWNNSVIVKPPGVNIVCQASAWDFSDDNRDDFRIKQCTVVNDLFFRTTHHEMGHVQYYIQYRDQPSIFRNGANPGFHEAIGDTILLSVTSAKHLHRIGLLQGNINDTESEINNMYKMALEKLAILPYAYMLDLYRYAIFRGRTLPQDYNCHFWALRQELQGLEPPVERSEEHFDAGAKFHVAGDVEYARYFVAQVLQFQFHRRLCYLAGEYVSKDPNKKLANCDIYNSTTAGNAFAKMLRMGSSKPWPDAMEVLTGQRKMKSDGFLEYFKPLHEWLKAENMRTKEHIGWEHSKISFCSKKQKAALKHKNPWKAEQ